MKRRQYLFFSLLGLLPTTVVLFIFAYLGGFTRLIADDYCSAYYAKNLGFFDSILFSYRTINGRYSAYGTDWTILNIFDAEHIRLLPQIILLVWVLSFILSIYSLLALKNITRRRFFWSVSFAVLILFLILTLSPNIPQSVYWWNGMRSYTLPLVVLTAGGGIFYVLDKKVQTKLQILGSTFFSFFFFFANGGLSETYLVLQILLFVFLLFYRFFCQKKHQLQDYFLLLAGLFGSLVSLAVVLHSYANVIRRSVMPAAPDIQTLLHISWESYLFFLGDTFSRFENIFAVLGAVLLAFFFGMISQRKISSSFQEIGLYFLAGFGFLFASFVPGVYGYVKFPPTRTLITGVFFFTLFMLYTGFLLGNRLSLQEISEKMKTTMIILATGLLFFSATMNARSLYETRETYLNFAEKWDQVDAQILQAKQLGEEEITIPGMDNWAKLDRPNENPKFWATRCYSLYYDIQIYGPPY